MKRNYLTLLPLVLLFALAGCANSNQIYVHQPIENSDLSIYIGIKPTGRTIEGKAEYDAFLFWDNYGATQEDGEFNDAQILIDGIAMNNVNDDFFRINSGDGLTFDVGDTFEVVVQHSMVGTLVKTLTVPENIASFTTDPILTVGVDNVHESYTMSWSPAECDEYSVKMERGSSSDSFSSYSTNETGTSFTWDQSFYFYENNVLITRIRYSLMAANKASFENLSSGAKVFVTSPIPATLANY